MRLIAVIKSWKFWLTLLVAPLLLVACAGLFVSFDSDFISDEYVSRHTVKAGDVTLSYLMAGDPRGQRVIFLHGTPGDAGGNWYNILKNVPEGYEFIAIDRPGFGHTLPSLHVTSLNEQAASFAPLLIGGNRKGSILVGHSLGGPVVATAAANYPETVAGIVIAAGALDPDLEEVLFVQHVGDMPPFSWLLDRTLRNANRELIALEGELRLLQPKLSKVTQPVMIIHGTADKLVPVTNVAFMERELKGSRFLRVAKLDGKDHFLQWHSNPVILEAIANIRNFLESAASTDITGPVATAPQTYAQ